MIVEEFENEEGNLSSDDDRQRDRNVVKMATAINYTPSQELRNLILYDNTAEIIGFVDEIESPKIVGHNNNSVFKFLLDNNDGEKIQVVGWNAEIERFEYLIRSNMIIHIDGGYVNVPKDRQFNKGTVNTEIILQSSTIINTLGKKKVPKIEDVEQVENIEIKDAGSCKKYSQIEGFIKTNFNLVKQPSGRSPEFGCGSVTDGKFKLEVRIFNYDPEHVFEKGQHVRLRGYMQTTAHPIYFQVKSFKDIELVDNEIMSLANLLRARRSVEAKRSAPDDNASEVKKSKDD